MLFDSRQVHLIAESYDVAIGGGFELASGHTSRVLAPMHLIAVAAPAFVAERGAPLAPADLALLPAVVLSSRRTGRVPQRVLRDAAGNEVVALQAQTVLVDDSTAMCEAARLGLGIALVAMSDALTHLRSGALIRVLPRWYADLGSISLYFASRTLLPGKTRVFIDHISEAFRRERLAERFAGNAGWSQVMP